MVFDLRRALLRKEEIESARLMDFEFRLRARTMRLLAGELGLDPDEMAERIAVQRDEAILSDLAVACDLCGDELYAMFRICQANSRQQLTAERGDPTPYRLG